MEATIQVCAHKAKFFANKPILVSRDQMENVLCCDLFAMQNKFFTQLHREVWTCDLQDGVFLLPSCCDPFNEKALRASRGAAFRIPIASGHWPQIQVFAELQHLKLYAADPEQEHVEQKCGMDLESHVMHDPPVRFDTSKTVSSDSERPQDFDEMSHSSGSTGNRVESISSERTLVGKAPSHRKDSIVSVAEEKALCLVLGSEGQGLSETVRQSCKQLSIHMPGDFESLNVAVAGGILLYLLMIRAPCSGDSLNAL